MAQIREAHPRRAGALSPFGSSLATVSETTDRAVEEELVGRSFDDRLAEWWDSLTENLSQTTFFLLDPESWR
jgi:N-methylhydantoinase A/oxoprolinase/acetone carboxylase beta subunit